MSEIAGLRFITAGGVKKGHRPTEFAQVVFISSAMKVVGRNMTARPITSFRMSHMPALVRLISADTPSDCRERTTGVRCAFAILSIFSLQPDTPLGLCDGDRMGQLQLFYGGKQVLHSGINKLRSKQAYLHTGTIEAEFQGKRLAALMYYTGAWLLAEQGFTLRSDPRETSLDADRMWKGIVRHGFGSKRRDGGWGFSSGKVKDVALFAPTLKYLDGRIDIEISSAVAEQKERQSQPLYQALLRAVGEENAWAFEDRMALLATGDPQGLRKQATKYEREYSRSLWPTIVRTALRFRANSSDPAV